MATGLQIFDANGKVILDTNFRIARTLAIVPIGQSGSITDARLTTGTPFWSAVFSANPYGGYAVFPYLTLTVSGSVLTWEIGGDWTGGISAILQYGVF